MKMIIQTWECPISSIYVEGEQLTTFDIRKKETDNISVTYFYTDVNMNIFPYTWASKQSNFVSFQLL